jgi:hypothetical protein
MSAEAAIGLLGETCSGVYLNDVAYWRCVPANVWRFRVGGVQVIKKWLSHRERALLGRDLKPEEARYVTEVVRRTAALVLVGPEIDANYERVKTDVWEWGRQDHCRALLSPRGPPRCLLCQIGRARPATRLLARTPVRRGQDAQRLDCARIPVRRPCNYLREAIRSDSVRLPPSRSRAAPGNLSCQIGASSCGLGMGAVALGRVGRRRCSD